MKTFFVVFAMLMSVNTFAASCLLPASACPNLNVPVCTHVVGWQQGRYGEDYMGWAGGCGTLQDCDTVMTNYCSSWYGGTLFTSDDCDNSSIPQDLRIEDCYY